MAAGPAHAEKHTAAPEKKPQTLQPAVESPELAGPELAAQAAASLAEPSAAAPPGAPPPPRTILQMQRAYGNRATQQLLAQHHHLAAPGAQREVNLSPAPRTRPNPFQPPAPAPDESSEAEAPGVEAPTGPVMGAASSGAPAAPPIQRGLLDDARAALGGLDPTVLIQQATSILTGGDEAADQSESEAGTQAQELGTRAEGTAQAGEQAVNAADQQAQQEQSQVEQQVQQTESQGEQGQSQITQAGEQGAGEIAAMQGASETALSLETQLGAAAGGAAGAGAAGGGMAGAGGAGGAGGAVEAGGAGGAGGASGAGAAGGAMAGAGGAGGAGGAVEAGGAGGAAGAGPAGGAMAGAGAAGGSAAGAGAAGGAMAGPQAGGGAAGAGAAGGAVAGPQAAGGAGAAGGGAAGAGAAGMQQAVAGGVAADAAQGLSCPEADILGQASGLGKRALDALITGADALTGGMASRVANLAQRVGSGLARAARYVGEAVSNVANAVKQRITQMAQPLVNLVNQGVQVATNAFNNVRTRVTNAVQSVTTTVREGVSWVVNNGPRLIQRGISAVQTAVGGAVQRVAGMIGGAVRGLIGRLPGGSGILSGIDRLRGKISSVITNIRSGVNSAIERGRAFGERVLNGARSLADRALQTVVQGARNAADLGRRVVTGIGTAARTIYETVVPAPVRQLASSARQFIGEQVNNVRSAAGDVMKGIAGEVCVPLNEIAEPCINQYLPFSKGSESKTANSTTTTGATSSAITLSSSTAVTIPLAEFGIPGSAEVGRGASVSVRRSGARAYSVSVSGESTVFYVLEASSPAQASVQVDSPVGGGDTARGDAIWQQLAGGGGGGGADGGGSTGAGGPTAKAGIKAGQRRTIQVNYGFDVANSTCDLASLAGLLGTYGLSGAISAIVPQPFSTIVSATGNAVAAGGWASHITGVSLTNANVAEASAKASQPGQGSVSGQIGVESSTSVGLSRQDDGSFRPEASFSQAINGQLAGEMNLGGLFTAGGSVGASGSQSLTLIYDRNSGLITPSSLETSLQATLGLQGFNVSAFPAEFIPSDAAAIIAQNLEIVRRTAARGNVSVQLRLVASNIEALTAHVANYLATAPIDQVTWAGVMRKVREGMQRVSFDRHLTVTATEIRRAGISGEAEVNVEGTAIGVQGSVSAERRITHTLYSNQTRMSGPTLNPTPAPNPVIPPPGPTPTPDHPEPVHPVPDRPGPTPPPGPGPNPQPPQPPSRKNPLDMTADEFEADTAAQDELFGMAHDTRARQQGFGHSMIAEARASGNVSSILKRNERDAFVAGVLEKVRRKGYSRIGEMPDIVRGRFNLDRLDDVNSVVLAITQQTQFRLVEPPVPPREREGVPMGYPRWHIVVEDSNRIIHEWQIGTQATTDVYEQRGINIPPEVLPLPSGMHNDIHDIEYDILKRIQEDHPDIAAEVGIPTFRRNVALASADSGRQGVDMPDKNERIVALHNECSTILRMLVDRHGANIIRKYFKNGSSGGPEES